MYACAVIWRKKWESRVFFVLDSQMPKHFWLARLARLVTLPSIGYVGEIKARNKEGGGGRGRYHAHDSSKVLLCKGCVCSAMVDGYVFVCQWIKEGGRVQV